MIKESVLIARAPRTVWSYVADPNRLPLWNEKAVAVSAPSGGAVQRGSSYRVTYRMGGRDTITISEVDVFEPFERLELRVIGGMAHQGFIREIYTLEPVFAGTRLVQRIDMSNAGIPWFWRILLAVLHRVGRPTGKRYLVVLKELIESSTPEGG